MLVGLNILIIACSLAQMQIGTFYKIKAINNR